jgi:N-methylhydantoinase A
MAVEEIEVRPILTMLSGPAAGVAGALHYENVTDAIFIEVGGTSADCCAIRAGRPQMHHARVGGHRTMLRTIDSRTLAIAGGSVPRISRASIVDVGPRSAHIAGCAYAAFLTPDDFDGARVERFAPHERDSADYLRFALRNGSFATLTPTCASNLLGYAPEGSFAAGNVAAIRRAFQLLVLEIGGEPENAAQRLLEIAGKKLRACVEELVADYGLSHGSLELVGGGGGATALVPFVARSMGLRHRIARDAEVISPIGVALALVRDVVERTIVDPSPDDIARIRREASDRVIAGGAAPETIEVSVEIDAQRNIVRASAAGATAMTESNGHGAVSLAVEKHGRDVRVVDERGVVRLYLRDAQLRKVSVADLEPELRSAIEDATAFGDVGRALPSLYLVHGGRIADFSGLASVDQGVALALEEIEGRDPAALVTIITVRSRA